MAGTSLLTLIDDIANLLDDVAGLTKAAAHKSAGVLGDDLALNAQQVTGIRPNRELPVVFAVAKGSLVNKAILVPAALLISALLPWLVTPLLMLGGAFLCFEGFEKVMHKLLHPKEKTAPGGKSPRDPERMEKSRVTGAVRTDFILSAEVIVISLGTMTEADFLTRVGALIAIAILMTVGVYGLVAGIVKMDDAGLALSQSKSSLMQTLGRGLLGFAPIFMRVLGVVGTAAMFLVGGGILLHGIPPLEHLVYDLTHSGTWLASIFKILFDGLTGILAGAIIVGVVTGFQRLRTPKPA